MNKRSTVACALVYAFALLTLGVGESCAVKKKVVFWAGYGLSPESQAWEAAVKDSWRKKYPNVQLSMEHPQGDFLVSAAAGVVPDVHDTESRVPWFVRVNA